MAVRQDGMKCAVGRDQTLTGLTHEVSYGDIATAARQEPIRGDTNRPVAH